MKEILVAFDKNIIEKIEYGEDHIVKEGSVVIREVTFSDGRIVDMAYVNDFHFKVKMRYEGTLHAAGLLLDDWYFKKTGLIL